MSKQILSLEDQVNLQKFEDLRNLLRDRVRSAALKYQNGAYIVGRPGTGKTVTVVDELNQLAEKKENNVSFTVKNAKMTAPGLWKLLHDYREGTCVLDDIPSIVSERPAQMILMAALSGMPGTKRKVTQTTGEADGRKDFDFSGSIIAISNVSLRRDALADAIASRVPLLEFEPTDEMIAAFMRSEAFKGFRSLDAVEATAVVEYVISESRAGEYRLDLRAMTKAWSDFEQWRHGHSTHHWRDLVRSFMKKLTTIGTVVPATRAEKRCRLREIAAAIGAKYPDRKQKQERDGEWSNLTGLSADQLYRHLREVEGVVA